MMPLKEREREKKREGKRERERKKGKKREKRGKERRIDSVQYILITYYSTSFPCVV